jgi:hypothetical protein
MADPFDLNNLFGLSLNPQQLAAADDHVPGISPPVQQQYAAPPPQPIQAGSLMGGLLGQQSPSPTSSTDADSWQPHKRTTLGTIADIVLGALGATNAPFKQRADRQNMQSAMTGFSDDPMGTIKKISKIPGMEGKAMELYEHYQNLHKDDAENAQRMEYYKGINEDRSRGVLSSYLGAVNAASDPQSAYTKVLPMLRSYAQQRGLPEDLLPDTYDPELAKTVMVGGIKPEQQLQLGETHSYHQSELGIRQQGVDQTGQYRERRLQQLGQHEGAYEQHNTNMESIARDKASRPASAPRGLKPVLGLPIDAKVGTRKLVPLKNKDGSPVTDGPANTLYQFEQDGRWHAYQKVNGQIQKLGTISKARDGRWYQD